MKKVALVLVAALVLALFVGCTGDFKIEDGTYRAEYADYDQQGYKEYVEITFENGGVTDVVFDAISGVDGSLKSEATDMSALMESATGTTPKKSYEDIINQYLQNPSADSIDIVAGATASTRSFVALVQALEKAVKAGNTETVIVDRP